MLPRQIERLAAVFRLEGRLSMNFRQIVEQFYVELVILDDKDFFWSIYPLSAAPGEFADTLAAKSNRFDVECQ